MKNKIFKFSFKNLIISFIFAGIMLILSLIALAWNPVSGLDNKITDMMYQREKANAAKEIVIVGIDDNTIDKYHNYNPIEYRKYFADILNMWADNDCVPAAIGFDVIFNNTYGCDDVDLELSNAMKRHNIVLGVNGASRKDAPYGLSQKIYEGAKSIGFVDAVTDADEAVRRGYLRGDNYDSLSYAIYKMYCNNTNKEVKQYEIKKPYYFDYYAKPELNYTPDGIVKEGKPICDKVYEKYNKKLEFGVGVHSGSAVIGNIGSKTRMDFTAIGDTVNTASRIEGSASGDQVLISKDVYELVKDRVKVIDAGDRMFKNKKEPITCYEVVDVIGYDSTNKGE